MPEGLNSRCYVGYCFVLRCSATIRSHMPNPLRQYRKVHKLSRADLKAKLGCSISFIGHIERGIREVSPETAIEWEKKLGIPRHLLRPDLWSAPKVAA